MTRSEKPIGREAVMAALIDATIEFIKDKGVHLSAREVAASAGVNHGLVHTYFGSKQGLLQAAADEINRRAAADADDSGFPPVDLASRRGGELARAVARMRLDDAGTDFSSHPVLMNWKHALEQTRPELSGDEIDSMLASSAVLAMGWALFADYIEELLDVDADGRARLDRHIEGLVAELGGLPQRGESAVADQ